jgi:asparagine synthase (glutamine-hydrolysing)
MPFYALLDPRGLAPPTARTPPASFGAAPQHAMSADGAFHAFVAQAGRARIARSGSWIAVGEVRLDAQPTTSGAAGDARERSDLERLLDALARDGEGVVDATLGDFAFVAYDARTKACIAARDPFGVKALYLDAPGATWSRFASRARLLAPPGADGYDPEFVAGYFVGLLVPEQTMWRAVRAHPSGSVSVRGAGATRVRRFWAAERFAAIERGTDEDRCRELGDALRRAVLARVEGREDVVAQLSGGLDSSSVVCVAAALARAGDAAPLATTVTCVDPFGEGDEAEFSDAVLAATGLGNVALRDVWPFRRDDRPPPRTDYPWPALPWYAMHRRMCDAVVAAGGRVLLSGQGSDQVLDGRPIHLADEVARGNVRGAARDLLDHAVAERGSFWGMGLREVVAPLLGARAQLALADPPHRLPVFLAPGFAERSGMREKLGAARACTGPVGSKFDANAARELAAVPMQCEREPFDDAVEMRYPFLDRRVVEVGLALPPRLRVSPRGRKWALREAMRGTLPEAVRARTTKCGPDARVAWALTRERPLLDAMLAEPLSARLGWLDASALRREVDAARRGDARALPDVLNALALELWLRVADGQPSTFLHERVDSRRAPFHDEQGDRT